ncbi:sulfite exporter TauE/SafE family protein [Falsibacillus albus]|uniref:Probable membrane transporter protein n=1 Tax=Falsibacillus albus TaxID=2478915 RepID=A0A3L7JLU0_9BACI|nr:sulfite exporter TauE/SafE family protein [Falsibacillus albus]RLQ90611.1 sulfite exporter TauE/SafE family protein [Falsibacillus albus]
MTFLLVICIGFSATFVGTLAGSGGLIGMPLLLLIGVPVHSAIASAKFSNIISSFSSFYYLLKEKEITMKLALSITPFAVAGGIAGGVLTNSISETHMKIIAVCLLSFALILNLFKKSTTKQGSAKDKITKRMFPYLFSISAYDGMFGPGQATLLMIIYLRNGFSYLKAVGLSRFQTFVSCLGAFFMYLGAGNFDWKIGVCQAAGSFIGAMVSVRLAKRLSLKQVKYLLNAITLLLILQLGYEALHS